MKEYLDKDYVLRLVKQTSGDNRVPSGWIEVPSGANIYALADDGIKTFWSDEYQWLDGEITRYIKKEDPKYTFKEWALDWDSSILWQRPAQPEALNDQYAEIEKVCQAMKVESGSNSDHTEDAMSYGFIGLVKERENNHYFKDVSDIDTIDVYEVLKRFNVTDPCLQHLIKKALCIGNRGHKDLETDLRDILKSAKRALEINGFSL